MTDEELQRVAAEARIHADNLRLDIANANDRTQHIRLTRLATEAEHLAANLEKIAARPSAERDYDRAYDDRARAYGQPIVDFPTH